ncbi:hypothetical protein FRB99_004920 [Tulasnella sp. 403]|nr:hypothetical protein FRB99_004920 [Tulasnella sp. 403]
MHMSFAKLALLFSREFLMGILLFTDSRRAVHGAVLPEHPPTPTDRFLASVPDIARPHEIPRFVAFQTCNPSLGLVHSVSIQKSTSSRLSHGSNAVVPGNGQMDVPAEFHWHGNYSISITFSSPINVQQPRSMLLATDRPEDSEIEPYERKAGDPNVYPYSGQSYDACKYMPCPVSAHTVTTYTYHFETLRSEFDWLMFNVTDGFSGPSIMCVGFPVSFNAVQEDGSGHTSFTNHVVELESGRGSDSADEGYSEAPAMTTGVSDRLDALHELTGGGVWDKFVDRVRDGLVAPVLRIQ